MPGRIEYFVVFYAMTGSPLFLNEDDYVAQYFGRAEEANEAGKKHQLGEMGFVVMDTTGDVIAKDGVMFVE